MHELTTYLKFTLKFWINYRFEVHIKSADLTKTF